MTEWDLLVASEDISKGDNINIEEESGETAVLMFLKVKAGTVYLSDAEGECRWFSAESLEEVDGTATIAGKAEDEE